MLCLVMCYEWMDSAGDKVISWQPWFEFMVPHTWRNTGSKKGYLVHKLIVIYVNYTPKKIELST